MKNLTSFITSIVIIFLIIFSCAQKQKLSPNEWYEEDKKEFMKDCTEPSNHPGITKDQVKIYCECMMEKIMKKYPKYSDTYNKEKSEFKDMIKECDEKAGIKDSE
jgi:ABC-type Zn uptake system ZnuABC Zn-binding protein ZnuA